MKQRQSFSSTFRKHCRGHFFCSSQWKAGTRGNTWTPIALLAEAEESEIVGYPSLQSDWRSSLSLEEWKKRTRRWWARRERRRKLLDEENNPEEPWYENKSVTPQGRKTHRAMSFWRRTNRNQQWMKQIMQAEWVLFTPGTQHWFNI